MKIIERLKRYFSIKELVSKAVYLKYGETAWQFFDIRLLETLLFIREELGLPITINDWSWGGSFDERGYRENTCDIVLGKTIKGLIYCSAHVAGQGIDFDVEGITAQEVRDWLIANQDKLPYPIRLEEGVSWVHLDVRVTGKKIYLFKVKKK